MYISDIVYLVFLMVLLFIVSDLQNVLFTNILMQNTLILHTYSLQIIYKSFLFTARSSESDNNFNATRDELYYNRHCLTETGMNI